jgi:hypothetical protein
MFADGLQMAAADAFDADNGSAKLAHIGTSID